MKKHRLALTILTLATAFAGFFACSKYNATSTPTNTIPLEQTVTASLQGRVVDENGLPVKDAAVTSGAASTTTDVNGIFSFTNISLSSRFGFVKVVKPGYFTGSRSIITRAGSQNYVSIQLLPRTAAGIFAAATGGNIPVRAGDTVSFTGSSVVTAATNAGYTGDVHVFATYLDPTDPNIIKFMPGDLRGIGKDGKETGLQSFGMMAVELEGDAGEKLQIAAGQKATLTWAIPASLQATAPTTIPLWYFNDSSGRWIEQGTAIRVGNNYVGQVGHFSFWNCDAPVPTVNFKVRLKDQFGNPLAYTLIEMQSQIYGTAGGYTDSSGYAQGLLPVGQIYLMQVLSDCGNMLAGVNVGPTLADVDLGTITVTINHAELNLTGTVTDCYGQPVTNGFVNAKVDGLNYRAILVNGGFTLPVKRCFNSSAQVVLTAVDLTTTQQNTKTITAATGDVDAGQISACGTNIAQFISFSLDGGTYNLVDAPDNIASSLYTSSYYVNGSASANGSPYINFRFPAITGPGTYSLDSMIVSTKQNFNYYQNESMTCTITNFGPVNGSIEGNFSGTLYFGYDLTKPKPITGSFKVTRKQ